MSFRTGGTTTAQAQQEPNDDAYEAMPEHPPALKLGIGICEFVWGIFSNCVQVATSAIAIMAMILGGAAVAGTSMPDLMRIYPWAALVGLGIALSIQLFLHKNAQSMGSTWNRLRQIQHFNIKSTHTWTDIKNAMTFSNLYFFLALIADIVSDSTFINLYTHNAYVILFWIAFLTGSSTLLMYDGATRIWGAIEDYKDYTAYHERHDPERYSSPKNV